MKGLVVGFGSIGRRHVKNLLAYSDMKVIICTKNNKAKKLGNKCKVYQSLDKCLDEEPDFAIIANVTSSHVKTALKVSRRGIDLLIEKPLSNSLNGINQLSNIIIRKKLVSLIGCNLRFHKCIKKIRELLHENKIGKVISVQAEYGSYLPDWHPYEDYRKGYSAKKELGGGVVFTNIHEIDYLYWFFGKPKGVFSMGGKFSNLEISVNDLALIIMHFKNGVFAQVHLDHFQRPSFRGCKIIGTKGTIDWNSNTNSIQLYDIKNKRWLTKMSLKKYDWNSMYVEELAHFIDCVKKRNKTLNPLSEGIETLKVALAIMKSSDKKKFVVV